VGAIKALESGSIEDGAELKVTYDYAATDSTTTTILDLIPDVPGPARARGHGE